MKLVLPFSITFLFWSIIGFLRTVIEKKHSTFAHLTSVEYRTLQKQVAVCLPAHNEERTLTATINSLRKMVRWHQIYVVSDGSTDATAKLAKSRQCNLLTLRHPHGKGHALQKLIKRFRLLKRYNFIIFADADTVFDKHYLTNALSYFSKEPSLAAIAGYVETSWRKHSGLRREMFFYAYRYRLNRILQLAMVYGQSWKKTNVVIVAPGSCSIYRTSILQHVTIAIPGLLSEDFSLTFQIHKKRLGWIGHDPRISSYDHEPTTFADYIQQVKRWNISFFQTVRTHGIWPSLFWLSTGFFIVENIIFSLAILVIFPAALFFSRYDFSPGNLAVLDTAVTGYLTVYEIVLLLFVIDYLPTLLIAISERKYKIALYGIGFFVFQFLNAAILLYSILPGFLRRSGGTWIPPTRNVEVFRQGQPAHRTGRH